MQRTFDQLTKTLDLQREIALDVRTLHSFDALAARALVSQLADIVGLGGNGVSVAEVKLTRRGRPGPTGYDKIAAIFVGNNNTPMTKAKLAEEADMKEGTVHTVVYGARPTPAFVRKPNPAGGREKVISLTTEALNEAKANSAGE